MQRGPGRNIRLARRLASLVCALSCIAAGPGPAAASSQPRVVGGTAGQPRPDVIVVETDDQALETMKVMRNVNSLIGGNGATFINSFVNFSLCCPSRSTFLTGQYAHNHGVWSNVLPDGGFDRFEDLHATNNLAVWLRDAGYHTGMIGKYLNGYANLPPVPPGWSEWHATAPYEQRVYNYPINNNGTLTQYGQDPTDYKSDVLTRKAVDFVNRRAPKAQPYFLWLTYTAPHAGGPPNPNPPYDCLDAARPAPRHAHAFDTAPLPRPPDFNEADVSDKPSPIRNRPPLGADQIADIERKYRCGLESLLAVDDGVKRIVDALQANGALDDTLIIYTSDNGFFRGEHRVAEGKQRVYEESIRVPLLMRGPGIPPNVRVSAAVTNADLAPTIAAVAQAIPRLVMDGRPLIPVAQEPKLGGGRPLLIEEPTFAAIRTERYAYVEYRKGDRELYDLRSDPYELESRHDDPAYALVQAALANELHKLQSCAGDACRIHWADPSP